MSVSLSYQKKIMVCVPWNTGSRLCREAIGALKSTLWTSLHNHQPLIKTIDMNDCITCVTSNHTNHTYSKQHIYTMTANNLIYYNLLCKFERKVGNCCGSVLYVPFISFRQIYVQSNPNVYVYHYNIKLCVVKIVTDIKRRNLRCITGQ